METEGSLPSSEQPVTCPYIQPDESSPAHFNILLKSMPRSFKWSSSIRFPHQSPVCNSSLPPTSHMPRPSHSFVLITRIISCEENRSLSSSLCSLLQLSVTSFVLGPNCFSQLPILEHPHRAKLSFTSTHTQKKKEKSSVQSSVCFSLYVFGYQIMLMKIFEATSQDMTSLVV